MTVKHRMFFSFVDEKRWLEKMNSDGLELMRAAPFKFEFEKTDIPVLYEYVPLRHGRKSFSALNYKKKDKYLKAVYAKADMALFKKPESKGKPELLTSDERLLAFARYKSSVSMYALMMLALTAVFILLSGRTGLSVLYFPALLFLLAACGDFYRASRTEQYLSCLRLDRDKS